MKSEKEIRDKANHLRLVIGANAGWGNGKMNNVERRRARESVNQKLTYLHALEWVLGDKKK